MIELLIVLFQAASTYDEVHLQYSKEITFKNSYLLSVRTNSQPMYFD